MYEILRRNLECDRKDGYGLWWLIKDIFEIHLGVAEKCGLLMHLKQTNHNGFFDLQYDSANYLWNMGYQSNHLKLFIDECHKDEKVSLEIWERAREIINERRLAENQ